ncbi:MAG TPA: 5-(carboxyamino)imidazole ribonucleotide mutase [Candidatus Binataceae bacterium]|nr:5-(carboxyamino)imidazole ribonucleotide mutase [Candidatus Binataceae bacterium]
MSETKSPAGVLVGVIMGSKTDLEYLNAGTELLAELGIGYEVKVLSAHRTPEAVFDYARAAAGRGLELLIAGAGGAAHLPGVLAANTLLPVIGVPIPSTTLGGMDSLLSIVQMPRGVPVATMAIGKPGAGNAALFAAAVLAPRYPAIAAKLAAWRDKRSREALQNQNP